MITFGFNTARPLYEYLEKEEQMRKDAHRLTLTQVQSITKLQNVVNVVSAIFPPMGIARIVVGILVMNRVKGQEKPDALQLCTKSFVKKQIARGVGETLCLGFVFLIIDVIATIYNHFHYRSLDRARVSPSHV